MNIKRAKEEIKRTVTAYLAKDALGEYAIPAIRQRPILLMGPPGIGKTQIMEQIARECQVGLVAYTITHHTRQSAVGLPFIRQRHYGGRDVSVTEYTMSEIIASIYEKMESTGLKEGILFIDEINCVSETLAPTMLQFLQCKTFGNQAVPAGWVIVAAGNPPEYNKSVRDFDLVTLDRVRRMDLEPDLTVWKEYAFRTVSAGKSVGTLPAVSRPCSSYRLKITPSSKKRTSSSSSYQLYSKSMSSIKSSTIFSSRESDSRCRRFLEIVRIKPNRSRTIRTSMQAYQIVTFCLMESPFRE